MSRRISLALTLHNHQPVGNFGWVIADVCDHAYQPMVAALEAHPTIRLALHYTGPLLEWMAAERPGLLERIRALAARGQVELLGGALYEPILVAIPAADRDDQLRRMAGRVTELSGTRPRGAWLAERVWEPSLPTALADAGYEWTILDDNHFRAAALPDSALWTPWRTEEQGRRLTVFGTEQGLRYRIPFRPVEDVLDHLRRHATEAGDRLGTMGDDGEKFGAWPGTFEHCWGAGRWVQRFFEALEANADWIETTTPSGWLERHEPGGLAYLPDASYAEMGEWALPATESDAFARHLHEAQDSGRPDARWLRGASWRNFLVRYREANDLHKQMYRASAAARAMPDGPDREAALDHVQRGQSNDCYWHGLFGGLYLPDLRVAALRHLIAAEDAASAAAGHDQIARVEDLDADGLDDVLLADAGQVVTIDLADGGGIGAWDLRAARHPVAAVLRRRPEAYHARLREVEAGRGAVAGGEVRRDGGIPASIHELVTAKEEGLLERLVVDDHERRLGLVRFLAPSPVPASQRAGTGPELGDFVDGAFQLVRLEPGLAILAREGQVVVSPAGPVAVRVEKSIRLGDDRRSPLLEIGLHVESRAATPMAIRIGVELPTMLLGGGGNPAAWWELDGRRSPHDGVGGGGAIVQIAQGNDELGISIRARVEPPADARWEPIETISNSEGGFERVYQGSGLLLSWPVTLEPGRPFTATIRNEASCREDAAVAEPPSA